MNKSFPKEKKEVFIKLFSIAYDCLRHFCFANEKNQQIMYSYLPIFLKYLKYDIGQIKLVISIF